MSIMGEINTDMYRQIMELQEKLKQSETERFRLEEMFTVLVKTYREEEDMRLKSLENRYHMFLEDCAKRSNRNEKILRSVERVESGANALHAKTERLKLLRSHYEAYIGRVIPTWRQPALPRYNSSPLPSSQEMEWSRRSQLIPNENIEPNNAPFLSVGLTPRPGRPYTSNPIITSEYFSNRLSDGEKFSKSFGSDKSHPDYSYWNRVVREPERRENLTYGYDKGFQGDINYQYLEPTPEFPSRPVRSRYEDGFVDEISRSPVKGLESTLHRKLAVGNRPDLHKDFLYQESPFRETPETVTTRVWDCAGKPEQVLQKPVIVSPSPVQRKEHWFSDRREALPYDTEKNYANGTPRMTREPVEIKKPEIVVGKVHSEASLKADYFGNTSKIEVPSTDSIIKPDNLLKPANDVNLKKNGRKVEPELVRAEPEVRQASPQEKWSLLKHRRTIDKLKETLSFEEAQEQKIVEESKQSEKIEKTQKSPEHVRKESDDTDVSQSLSEVWRPNGVQSNSPRKANDDEVGQQNGSEQFNAEPTYPEIPQKDMNDSSEEVFEDNEEAYPESYYEQPPKSDYSRDIVSNVILEEDESEVHEEQVQNQENVQDNNGYDQTQYNQDDNTQPDYNGYAVEGTGEMKGGGNGYENFQHDDPSEAYNNTEIYPTEYNELHPQEGYTYDNQDVNNYNTNNEGEYNAVEQYPQGEQYYESQQPEAQGNYPTEGMGQSENFDNTYNQDQNYDNAASELYNEGGDGAYQQDYNQGQDGNYYNQGEYDGYYQTQQEQSQEFIQQENMSYQEGTEYGNIQGDDGTYPDGGNNLPLRQSNLSHLLESDSESFQMEHGSAPGNEDSDFDFSMSQKQ